MYFCIEYNMMVQGATGLHVSDSGWPLTLLMSSISE